MTAIPRSTSNGCCAATDDAIPSEIAGRITEITTRTSAKTGSQIAFVCVQTTEEPITTYGPLLLFRAADIRTCTTSSEVLTFVVVQPDAAERASRPGGLRAQATIKAV